MCVKWIVWIYFHQEYLHCYLQRLFLFILHFRECHIYDLRSTVVHFLSSTRLPLWVKRNYRRVLQMRKIKKTKWYSHKSVSEGAVRKQRGGARETCLTLDCRLLSETVKHEIKRTHWIFNETTEVDRRSIIGIIDKLKVINTYRQKTNFIDSALIYTSV